MNKVTGRISPCGVRCCSNSCTEWVSYPFKTSVILTSELVAYSSCEPGGLLHQESLSELVLASELSSSSSLDDVVSGLDLEWNTLGCVAKLFILGPCLYRCGNLPIRVLLVTALVQPFRQYPGGLVYLGVQLRVCWPAGIPCPGMPVKLFRMGIIFALPLECWLVLDGVATNDASERLETLLNSDLPSDWSESLLGVLLLDEDDSACLVRSAGGSEKSWRTQRKMILSTKLQQKITKVTTRYCKRTYK